MKEYKVLQKQSFVDGSYSIVPLRFEDKEVIRQWRNEQLYHLRQQKPLTTEDQENYFNTVVSSLFEQDKPSQVLFSYLENGICIGYGGLVHINWVDRHGEISFIINTTLEKEYFSMHWNIYLKLIEQVAFDELKFHKIFTYAFDIRPNLYLALEQTGYNKEAVLKEHCLFDGRFIDVVIHSKINAYINLRPADKNDLNLIFEWANETDVRRNAFNTESIPWESHVNWFNYRIDNPDFCMFIMEKNGVPIGQIRFERESDYWKIGYSIDAGNRGQGMGKKIVELGLEKLRGKFKAWVKKENTASCKVFERLGFRQESDIDNVLLYVLDKFPDNQ